MDLPIKKYVGSKEETRKFAHEFIKLINEGDVIVLNGDLGVGKTFFVTRICECYNIKKTSSPSFAIVNIYEGSKKIYHFDFFRIKREEELYDIGFEEYLTDPEAIIFIEWGNIVPQIIPRKRIEINFNFVNETSREIEIKKYE